jgi:transposase
VSKARLVITAVVVEGRPIREVSAAYGVARSWIYELLAALKGMQRSSLDPGALIVSRPRSRRPPSN